MSLLSLIMKSLASIVFILLSMTVFGQSTHGIEWDKTAGGSSNERLYGTTYSNFGGTVICGSSSSDISGDKTEDSKGGNDYWVLELDSLGSILWQKTIGGDQSDNCKAIDKSHDGGYFLGGNSQSDISGDKNENSRGGLDYWILKIDSVGNILWQKTIGGSLNDELWTIYTTMDGGVVCGGYSSSGLTGDKTEVNQGGTDYWVVKLDSLGVIEWQNTIGGNGNEEVTSIIQTSDGGYLCGGLSTSNISGDKSQNSKGGQDFWVVKLNSVGNIQWQKTIGGSESDDIRSIAQTTDGGYILGGGSLSDISGDKNQNSKGGTDFWLVKINQTGNIQWSKTIGGSMAEKIYSLTQTSDGGYLIGGGSGSPISGDKTEQNRSWSDYWIVKTNSQGIIEWDKTIGGTGSDRLFSVYESDNGSFILGGMSSSDSSWEKSENSRGLNDYWIVKLSPTITSMVYNEDKNSGISIYPNPASDNFTVKFENVNDDMPSVIEFIDINGKKVGGSIIQNHDQVILSLDHLPTATYLIQVTFEGGSVVTERVQVVH